MKARLQERLRVIADMVTPGLTVADVGCDHALLPIYLVQNGISPLAYALDINRGPLSRAKRSIEEAGLSERIITVLSDGLKELRMGAAESVVIAGMGGPLMSDIIGASIEICHEAEELILEPQSDPALLRHFLEDNGFAITAEAMVREEGKFYPVIKCKTGRMTLSREIFYRYGKLLLEGRNPVLIEYLKKRKKTLTELKDRLGSSEETEKVILKREELKRDLKLLKEAFIMTEVTPPEEGTEPL